MRLILSAAVVLALSATAMAGTETFGWEGTETILGMYPDGGVEATVSTEQVHSGSQSLEIERLSESTPQAFVAWVVGLSDGDEVTASFWRYDVTPGDPPSCRIWGHWNDDPDDIGGYNGSAGGNSDYGPGTGWDETEHTWTVVEGHTGLVIECRVYSNPGDIVWIDDLTVTAPDGATIYTPAQQALSSDTWGAIKASAL
ncbi:MAG: hypothetical protein R6U36_08845 [Candidatus Fermentibacteraceae bacterium]